VVSCISGENRASTHHCCYCLCYFTPRLFECIPCCFLVCSFTLQTSFFLCLFCFPPFFLIRVRLSLRLTLIHFSPLILYVNRQYSVQSRFLVQSATVNLSKTKWRGTCCLCLLQRSRVVSIASSYIHRGRREQKLESVHSTCKTAKKREREDNDS
jgi:hypothetical protein